MKYFVFALCVAAASATATPPTVTGADADEVQQIIDSIYHPSTDPATAAALEQMLLEVLGINKPVIVDDESNQPIVIEPEIIDESIISEPGVPEESSPIDIGPAIIDESIVSEPANYPPLVQVIVNVNTNVNNPGVVEQPEIPEDVIVVEKPEIPEVIVVEKPEIPSEPVVVAPIEPVPVITLPDTLN
ncbi:uncharacterized protein LOC112046759 [Bicyclus anynana]|uniref:Uncharacterized protein LOC112046759 n=1 Tax=Bicyclus anynana TaxID=110368 RepID=A0ABM3LXB7_BICAN|nr:uncharacterized protein LOC112046759 [Bicyclus anynana]